MEQLQRLTEEHNRWLHELDPLAGPVEVPAGDRWVSVGPELVGSWQVSHTDPRAPYALWAPDVVENLTFRSSSLPTTEAFAELLAAWLSAREPLEARLGVNVPAMATTLIPALLTHGFHPTTSAAVRTVKDEPIPVPDPHVRVRDARPGDRDTMLDLLEEMHVAELPFGATMGRPDPRDLLGVYVDEALSRPGWSWLALSDDRPVGLLTLNPPQDSEWAAPLVSIRPVAYLGFAAVTAATRGSGVGRALVAHAMSRAAGAGCAAVVLDHASLSPLSSPFWHRQGFRPLWSRWARPDSLGGR